jgi:hypothetical protein
MRIAFDAKRAFCNTIQYLSHHYPENKDILYVPGKFMAPPFRDSPGRQLVYPDTPISKLFPSLRRSSLLPGKLYSDKIQLYHGLSNEIPFGINKYKIKSVVTFHDIIFLKFPEWYNQAAMLIYKRKTL